MIKVSFFRNFINEDTSDFFNDYYLEIAYNDPLYIISNYIDQIDRLFDDDYYFTRSRKNYYKNTLKKTIQKFKNLISDITYQEIKFLIN